jgi:lipid-binding SYLF domain-containing protein
MKTEASKSKSVHLILVVVFTVLLSTLWSICAVADDAVDTAQLIEKSRMTFRNFMTSSDTEAFRNLMKSARGVFICPQVLKGAFLVGVSGGSGVFLAYDSKTGKWSEPAFYTMGEVSFGIQAGGKASEIVLLAMTDRGVNAFLSNSLKLGVDAGIAAGPVGMGAEAATANLSADIVSYSLSQGLFGGISLEGAVITTRNSWNQAYYGKVSTPTDILILHNVSNPQSSDLVRDISEASLGQYKPN